MTDMERFEVTDEQEPQTQEIELNTPVAESVDAPEVTAAPRSDAGRRAAYRRMELIRLGQLYEQEHHLKRGRLRLQQLVQHGKQYELEHELVQPHKTRPSRAKAWSDFVEALSQVVKPAYRARVVKLAEELIGDKPHPKAA